MVIGFGLEDKCTKKFGVRSSEFGVISEWAENSGEQTRKILKFAYL
jgi:hypothetical protein